MTCVIGIDGGGTHMRAVIADESGRELARAESEGAVVGVDPTNVVVQRVTRAARAAAERAGTGLPARAMWAGLAGAGREEGRVDVARGLGAERLAESVVVGPDVEAAFQDAFGTGPGILLIAGTGSIAWARDPRGAVVRVGGWGERLGDEGSGFAIGMVALRAVARAEDGRGPRTVLADAVLDHLSLAAPDGLLAWISTASKGDVAALVPLVAAAAAAGDQVASVIVREAAAELVVHVDAALERTAPWPDRPEVILCGGLLGDDGSLRDAFLELMGDRPVRLALRDVDPAMGAARLALAGLDQAYGES